MTVKVKERRITAPSHIRQLITEQINRLRLNDELDDIARARAIAYLSQISLQAMRSDDIEKRLQVLEDKLNGR